MTLFDSHAHCDDERFATEYEGGSDKMIRDCFDNGVSNIVNIGTCLENSRASIELAHKYEGMYASCGIHPSDVLSYENVDDVILELEKLLSDEKAVALGEIGLDYHYENIPKEPQILYFEKQMELAKKLDIPVIIHDREAHGDCLEIIKKFPSVKGVFHSFSGSPEMATELVKLGWYKKAFQVSETVLVYRHLLADLHDPRGSRGPCAPDHHGDHRQRQHLRFLDGGRSLRRRP